MLAKRAMLALVAALAGVHVVFAQFIKPPMDLIEKQGAAGIKVRYKEVPGEICETTPGVKSYSGYSDIGEDQHMYWWFFERRTSPEDAPLTVWFNGGPGSSSLRGLLEEFGPCLILNNVTMKYNEFSWTNASNILFIDQPITVGFSYTQPAPGYLNDDISSKPYQLPEEKCPEQADVKKCGTFSQRNVLETVNSTEDAAPFAWKTIQGFVGAFPQYAQNGFHLAAESYGGHYGPVFARYFQKQDAQDIEGAVKLKLKSVLIGNGAMDAAIQHESYYKYMVSSGNPYVKDIVNKTYQELMYNGVYGKGNCLDQIAQCYETDRDDVCNYANDYCYDNVFYLPLGSTHLDVYDVRQTDDAKYPSEDFIDYLNRPNVLSAIGAFTNYSSISRFVQSLFINHGDGPRNFRVIDAFHDLLEQGVTVTIWAGDADYICNYLGNLEVANQIGHPGFNQSGFAKLQTSDNKTHGELKQAGQLTYASIFEAGHLIPSYQPEAALAVFERTINGLDIATGQIEIAQQPTYRTQGSKVTRQVHPTATPADVKKNTAARKATRPPGVKDNPRPAMQS